MLLQYGYYDMICNNLIVCYYGYYDDVFMGITMMFSWVL